MDEGARRNSTINDLIKLLAARARDASDLELFWIEIIAAVIGCSGLKKSKPKTVLAIFAILAMKEMPFELEQTFMKLIDASVPGGLPAVLNGTGRAG